MQASHCGLALKVHPQHKADCICWLVHVLRFFQHDEKLEADVQVLESLKFL